MRPLRTRIQGVESQWWQSNPTLSDRASGLHTESRCRCDPKLRSTGSERSDYRIEGIVAALAQPQMRSLECEPAGLFQTRQKAGTGRPTAFAFI